VPSHAKVFKANKSATTLLVLFIPSHNRKQRATFDQQHWVDNALATLGTLFGGATAYPQGKGVWRDDAQGGRLVFDKPVVIQCYTSEKAIEAKAAALREFLVRMGTETNQGAVGFVIDDQYLEIGFPLKN
jgi:hypothetical protein